MSKFFKHLATVTKHRFKVMRNCFRCGLIKQGLCHDLSKYSPSEFFPGVKYFQGNRSPQAKEREVLGYSGAWMHHKGRNKHHFEYWTDFFNGQEVKVDMPYNYFAEMICDRIAACKIYLKDKYTDRSALEYLQNSKNQYTMNPDTRERLYYYLTLLAEKGEKEFFPILKTYVKDGRRMEKDAKKLRKAEAKADKAAAKAAKKAAREQK